MEAKTRIERFVTVADVPGFAASSYTPRETRCVYFNDLRWIFKYGATYRSWVEWSDPNVADEIVEEGADLALGARLYVRRRGWPPRGWDEQDKRRERMRMKTIMHFVAEHLAEVGVYRGIIPENPAGMNTSQLTLSR